MFSAGTYLALPIAVLHTAVVTFSGVGMRRTTLVAASLALKPALTVMLYCTCDVPISLTVGWIRRGRLMSDVARYLRETYSSVWCVRKEKGKGIGREAKREHTSSVRTRRQEE
jgi:hypothetical protein